MAHVIVPLAEGFEEIEAIVPIDLMRRAGLTVTLAGVGSASVTGSRGVTISCDTLIEQIELEGVDAILLPGGMPGASNLAADWKVNEAVITLFNEGKLVAAICAAPAVVLGPSGILEGRDATCYPGAEGYAPSISFSTEELVIDGNLITSQGPGKAALFAFAVIEYLCGPQMAREVGQKALYSQDTD